MILSEIKENAEKHFARKLEYAVVSVPSVCDIYQRNAIQNACKLIGINVLQLLNNTTAAAITYVKERMYNHNQKNILIFDMGAVSTNIAVYTVTNSKVHARACGGDFQIGGDDFVQKLEDEIRTKFLNENYADTNLDICRKVRLRQACEAVKKMLSTSNSACYTIQSFGANNEPYTINITRDRFEAICADLFKSISWLVHNVLSEAETRVDEFIIIGGGGRIPKIQTLLEEFASLCGVQELSKVLNQDEAVAIGCAYLAGSLEQRTLFEVVDVTTRRISLVSGSCQVRLIFVDRNDEIPCRKIIRMEPFSDNYASHTWFFFEDNAQICNYRNIAPTTLAVEMDSSGCYKITAKNKLTGTEEPTIFGSNIEEMKLAQKMLEFFRIEDEEDRHRIDIVNNVEGLCLNYLRQLSSNASEQLNAEYKKTIKAGCTEIIDWLDNNKHSASINDILQKEVEMKRWDYFFTQPNKTLEEPSASEQLLKSNNPFIDNKIETSSYETSHDRTVYEEATSSLTLDKAEMTDDEEVEMKQVCEPNDTLRESKKEQFEQPLNRITDAEIIYEQSARIRQGEMTDDDEVETRQVYENSVSDSDKTLKELKEEPSSSYKSTAYEQSSTSGTMDQGEMTDDEDLDTNQVCENLIKDLKKVSEELDQTIDRETVSPVINATSTNSSTSRSDHSEVATYHEDNEPGYFPFVPYFY